MDLTICCNHMGGNVWVIFCIKPSYCPCGFPSGVQSVAELSLIWVGSVCYVLTFC